MAEPNKANLDDLPYDEYQKEMARMDAEAAAQAKNTELGNQVMPDNDDNGSFDDFLSKQKNAASGNNLGGADNSAPPDQAGDFSTGDPTIVTRESNPDAYAAGQDLQDQMNGAGQQNGGLVSGVRNGLSDAADAAKQGASRTISGAFQNLLGGIKTMFTNGSAGVAQMISNIGAKFGVPKAATYAILFIVGGGTFAGIAALLGGNNNIMKYGDMARDCDTVNLLNRENTVYKAPSQSDLDSRAGALFNALNSDMHFKYAIRDGGTTSSENITDDTKDDGTTYQFTQDPSKRFDWNGDGKIDEKDDTSRLIKGGYHEHDNTVLKFQDEQILGMVMSASAESKIDPSAYEMNYLVGPTVTSTDSTPPTGKDLVLSRTYHVQWNTYVPRMFALYGADGVSINQGTYTYTDAWGNSTDSKGQTNYYPGVGLWQWTGQRGYNLQWFANRLAKNTDADGDGANDAMYSLNVQIAYLVEIEAKPVTVNGVSIPIKEWGNKVAATYQEEYYVNVPYKNGIGTAEGGEANWIPLSDYQNPGTRHMTVAWDAYNQLRDQAKYKYESKSGARLSDKNDDNARDATYFADSDRYDGTITAFDDTPYPVKDYIYNTDGSIFKVEKHKFGSGHHKGTDVHHSGTWSDTNGDGINDTEIGGWDEEVGGYDYTGYDMDGDGRVKEGTSDLIIIDGKCNGHSGFDVDGDGKVDVWDFNDNGKIDDDGSDWYVDHIAYKDTGYKDGIFIPKEVYYQNLSLMVLAADNGNYNASSYIYEDDSNCQRQYEDKTTVIDHEHDKAKIIYQSPGITAVDTWSEKPWGDGTYTVCTYSEAGSVSVDYKAIQKGDMWWDQLEAARENPDNYGKEVDNPRDAFREAADTWRDEIWVWANAHARGAVARNKGLEFCLGWLGCPDGSIESHTMFVTDGSSFAGRLDTTKYNKAVNCIEHYAECMLKTDWHGSTEQGTSVTDLLYEDMDTSSVRQVWATVNNPCGSGDFDNSSIAACAVSWAWLKGQDSDADVNLSALDGTGCPKAYLCTSLYCAAHDIVLPGDGYYSSCDRGAATAVLASGSDDSFPAGNPYMQFDYMRSKPTLWQDCGTLASAWGSMKPGDIIVSSTTDPRHIIVFVGKDAVYEKWGSGVGDATYAIVHSSHSSNLSSSRGPRCDLDGSYLLSDGSHAFHVFRCMTADTSSSTKKSAIDDQASLLSGLNNGDGKGGGYYAPQY